MQKAYDLWCAFQDRILAKVAAIMLLGCSILAVGEVFRRYLLGQSFYWQQDAVTYFILSAVYLVFSISQRHDSHLNVTVFLTLLENQGKGGKKVAATLGVLTALFTGLFMAAVVWWGIPEAMNSQRYNVRTESLILPLWPFLWVLLLGFLMMAVSAFFQAYSRFQKLLGRKGLVEPEGAIGALH